MDAAFDCIVLGAGPAGSAIAGLIAAAGRRTLLVEPDRAPRFSLCQSLLPASLPVLDRLGVVELLRSGKFVPKYATELIGATGQPAEKFRHAGQPVAGPAMAELPLAWQVAGSQFDELLRRQAIARGAVTRDGARAVDVLFEGHRARGVRLVAPAGRTEEVAGRVIVDTTGPRSPLAERLGLRLPSLAPQRMAVCALYENALRATGIDGGSSLLLRTQDRRAWFWFIPLTDNQVSIGVIGNCQSLPDGQGKAESVFEEQLVKCPAVVERLADARLTGSFHVCRDFSWSSRQAAGDGWVLVGDALAGWDPLFSAGLWFGLRSAELAAASVIAALAHGDCSAGQLGNWAEGLARDEQSMRRLIAAFATDGFCPFEFLGVHPQHRQRLGDLLAGHVGESAGPLLDDLDCWQNRQHPLPERPEVLR